MSQEYINKLEQSIKNIKDRQSRIYLFVQDTKGHAKASVAYIYKMAMTLLENGYNPFILHESSDYEGVTEWLGAEYMEKLPHQSVENENLAISPEDFIVLPELYGYIMEQITKLPCGKIVLSQAFDHVFETLSPGQAWQQFGFYKCITTTETQKELLSKIFRTVSYDVLEPYISDNFKPNELPVYPYVAVHSREQRDSVNLIKQFYIKYPQYRWITFRDMRGLSETEFADAIRECCLSIWIDETSSYGTYPLECMKSGVPVLGLVPNIVPTWMNENNGFWVNNKIEIVDFAADYIQNWLEDSISDEVYTEMEKTVSELPTETQFKNNVISLFSDYLTKRLESFEEQANKLQTIEQGE